MSSPENWSLNSTLKIIYPLIGAELLAYIHTSKNLKHILYY